MILRPLQPRDPDSHKGNFGRALLVGGSRGMSGAIALAALATLRSGAGLVTIATADSCLDTVAGFEPCYMTKALADDHHGRIAYAAKSQILELAEAADCIALGPGIGQSEDLVRLVVELYQELEKPLVVDADALNCLAKHGFVNLKPGGPRVLTPHPGEFRRLAGNEGLQPAAMPEVAKKLAAQSRAVILLKGHRTQVTDGAQTYINETGNPGMATGGSGDVLTGIITALICQSFSPFEAACSGTYLHGVAGDIAAENRGQISLIARDIIDSLPDAFFFYVTSITPRRLNHQQTEQKN